MITIIVLLILAGITISQLTENGLFGTAKSSAGKYNKEEATEAINLKITTTEISVYTKEQRMPTLKELADNFCEDDDFQYVQETSKIASLTKISNTNPSSIFTKLKTYPYEFEINENLQLESIDGVKVATNDGNGGGNNTPNKIMIPSTISDISSGSFKINVNDAGANNSGELYYYVNNTLVYQGTDKSITVTQVNGEPVKDNTKYKVKVLGNAYELEFTTGEGDNVDAWLACIGNPNLQGYTVENLDDLFENTQLITDLLSSEAASAYLYQSTEVLLPAVASNFSETLCSSASMFTALCSNQQTFAGLCELKDFRESMYNHYDVTQSIISNSTAAIQAMKNSSQYKTTTQTDAPRTDSNDATGSVYSSRAFLIETNHKSYYNNNKVMYKIGIFTDGSANKSTASAGSTIVNTQINKFVSSIKGSRYNTSQTAEITYYYFQID